jgi:hypothetical protein
MKGSILGRARAKVEDGGIHTVPTGLEGYCCYAFPTLKRGANNRSAYGVL